MTSSASPLTAKAESAAARHLKGLIAQDGPVSVATLMEVALAHPDHGYYTSRPGIGNDFITAPEISQLFGEMLGGFVLQSWFDLGSPTKWQLIELGPGRGTLISDLLRVLKLRTQARSGVSVHLIETSEPLRRTQAHTLAKSGVEPSWHGQLNEVASAPSIIIANEFFDALPIRQFLRLNGRWCERRVALDPNSGDNQVGLQFIAVPTLFDIPAKFAHAPDAADGTVFEIAPAARAIAAEIGSRLADMPGRALIIDYGYETGSYTDTLQAMRNHRRADPLDGIGHADLTALVDFKALVEAARGAGAVTYGTIGQGEFLLSLGIRERYSVLAELATESQRESLARGLDRLSLPSQMGSLFRVLALSSPQLRPPPGFAAAS